MFLKALTLAVCVAASLHAAHGGRLLHQAGGASFLTCKQAKLADYTTKLWFDNGSGAKQDFGSYAVRDSESSSSAYRSLSSFGYSIKGYSLPNFLNDTAQQAKGQNAILCAPSKPELFAKPLDFVQVWNDTGSGADLDGALWAPVPPAGYKSLGDIWTIGYEKPSVDNVTVVADELVQPCGAGGNVWTDAGSGAPNDLTLKYASQMLSMDPPIGTGFQKGNTDQFYCLKDGAFKLELPSYLTCRKALESEYAVRSWFDNGSGAFANFGSYNVKANTANSTYRSLSSFGFSDANWNLTTFLNNKTQQAKGQNAILCAPSKPELFARPVDFVEVWNDKGSGADLDGTLWRPVAPAGYKSLGDIWTIGFGTKPNATDVTVVADEVVEACQPGGTVWTDAGSGADQDLTLRYASQMLSMDPPIGTGFQKGNSTMAPTDFYCIKAANLKVA